MKKVLSLCLALILCLCLTACNTDPLDASTSQSSTTVADVQATTTTTSTIQTVSSATATTTATPTTTIKPTTVKPTTTVTTTTTKATTTKAIITTTAATTTTTKTLPKESTITPALYSITNDTTDTTVWIFGSIHVGEEDMYPLPDYVLNAFDKADYLAVECDISDIDETEQATALQQYLYYDHSTIDDHISARLYEDAKEILKEHNDYSVYLNYYMPSLWADFINSYKDADKPQKSEFGVDLHLINLAKKKYKPIVEIESFVSQNAMMANFTPALQEQLLEEAVLYYYEPADSSTGQLLDLWKKGDTDALRELVTPTIDENESAGYRTLLEEYQRAMYTNRNSLMMEFIIQQLLDGKSTFVCIGAAHVIAEDGIIALFEKTGSKITRITE